MADEALATILACVKPEICGDTSRLLKTSPRINHQTLLVKVLEANQAWVEKMEQTQGKPVAVTAIPLLVLLVLVKVFLKI